MVKCVSHLQKYVKSKFNHKLIRFKFEFVSYLAIFLKLINRNLQMYTILSGTNLSTLHMINESYHNSSI